MTLLAVESRLYDDGPAAAAVRTLVKEVGLFHNTVAREELFDLRQHNWESVPPKTTTMLQTAFLGIGHSGCNKIGFHVTKTWKSESSVCL